MWGREQFHIVVFLSCIVVNVMYRPIVIAGNENNVNRELSRAVWGCRVWETKGLVIVGL